MSRVECVREHEVLDAIAAGRWPDKLGEELATHVASCSICADLGLVAKAFNDDYQDALSNVRVPSAGLVWWRAELRARQDAVRIVNRPINWAQYIAAGCGIVAVLIFLRLVDFSALLKVGLGALVGDFLPIPLVYVMVGALAVVISVAAYFVLFDD
jgi:hypothetical protein